MYKKQWQAKELVPICSKHLMQLTIEKGCEVGEFCKKLNLSREEHKYMFVERTHFDQHEHICDVILMDKVN